MPSPAVIVALRCFCPIAHVYVPFRIGSLELGIPQPNPGISCLLQAFVLWSGLNFRGTASGKIPLLLGKSCNHWKSHSFQQTFLHASEQELLCPPTFQA